MDADYPGRILAECQELLADLRQSYAGDPQGEYRRLSTLALEREQLVSYAYREDILLTRLRSLVAPAEVVALLNHAFVQVWRDEEAHTVLTRGLLVAGESRPLALVQTSSEQLAGLLAGWSSALKHHVPRSAAPLRSLFVDGIAVGARLIGKLSSDLRAELKHKSFRDFCRYNVDAEETAELCWRRLLELDDELGLDNRAAFERIAREEQEHRQVFACVAEALDAHDWLRPGVTRESLAHQLSAVGSRFVPARVDAGAFGSGATVSVIDTASQQLHETLDHVLAHVPEIADRTVAIKASWMMGYSTSDVSSVVDPELLKALVGELQRRGAARVVVLESPNLYSDIFDNRDVVAVARHFGLDQLGCDLVNASQDTIALSDRSVLGPTLISREWVQADVRISLVRLRSHPTEHVHASTQNLEGLIFDVGRNVFWRRTYHHSAAALAAAIEAPPTLAVIDARTNCPDGLFGIMAGAHTVDPHRVYVGTDALAVDLVALRHTGSARSVTSPTLRRAIEWFGDPRPRIRVQGADTEISGWRNPYDNAVSGLMADISYPVYGYLSQSGAVFAPPMDAPFHEKKPLIAPLRAVRVIARRVLGLHPPSS